MMSSLVQALPLAATRSSSTLRPRSIYNIHYHNCTTLTKFSIPLATRPTSTARFFTSSSAIRTQPLGSSIPPIVSRAFHRSPRASPSGLRVHCVTGHPLLHVHRYSKAFARRIINHQARQFVFSAAPRIIVHALRVPVAAAGTAAAGLTFVNYKVKGYTDRGTDFLYGIAEDMKIVLGVMSDELENFDVRIPEIHLQIPDFIKGLLASKTTTDDNQATTQRKFSAGAGNDDTSKSTNDSNPRPDLNTAAAIAAATAVVISDGQSQETILKSDRSGTAIQQHDEQFMMLTKKLIEIRTILMSIDHNETLKLPSIVVIGSQSSGKSSVLEAIVGHEFLPKGSNMVTRRPIELTLIHTPETDEEYGEFPQLGLGKVHDFKQVQKTLTDLNLAVPETECVSNTPIELRIYSPNIPDLTLIDLPGYIQIHNRNQPETLKQKIEELCEKYIREPNIILAVCAADVDLANSPALNASRKVDPLGLRTIGVITKMDLVQPEVGAAILRNSDYPLHLGYIGVVSRVPSNAGDGNMTGAVIRNEEAFFRSNLIYNQRGVNVGTATLRRKLMNVLEQSMGRSLYGIVDAVQKELEESRYQFKVQYNDRRVTAESYVAETMDSLKHSFKDFATSFGKPQVRHEVRTMLEQRVLDICAETYWSDPKVSELPKALPDDIYWLYKVDLSAAALTKSGVGRATTQLVVDVLMNNMEQLTSAEPFGFHPSAKKQILDFSSEILRNKFLTTSDQVENTIKPFKYEVEVTDQEWAEGVRRSIALLERELEMCDKLSDQMRIAVGKKKLRAAIKHVLDTEKEEQRRTDRARLSAEEGVKGISDSKTGEDVELEEVTRTHYNPKLLEKAREALFLRDRAMILKYRIAALKSRQCKIPDNKQFCPEAFLNVIAEKLTYNGEALL
ncbi:P-loop containing nucleoside triphosphate hydrolase protein [Jimgerdemannia flammicorona]|uniref:dynamin GTPase n=1 Tax=Jimgerdemannia flammicorona TaxID=994334 RepID=A0A433QVY6_9FUNG|nr:P-loop containing nucleoside triphosphate hydrolase protein [Jimgerdemannia flammicorona]